MNVFTTKPKGKLLLSLLLAFVAFPLFATGVAMQESYDTTRIYKAMAKARRGEAITIGVLGGSITQGYAASTDEKKWANLTAAWWRAKFPNTTVKLVNAGIGGTGSDVGAHRVKTDLLASKPDFVVVEFSVNDQESTLASQTMEGLVRQILKDETKPGLMMLMLKQQSGVTALKSHKPVAQHYSIPYISFAEWIDAKIAADNVAISSLFIDGLHPVDLGMKYIATFITDELERIYANLPADDKLPQISTTIPAALFTDEFENTYKYDNKSIAPVDNKGWILSGSGWTSDQPGSEIVFRLNGNAISFLFSRYNTPDRGQAEVWVDEGEHKIMDGYFTENWGPATVFGLVGNQLPDGDHFLHIKVASTHSATGSFFQILNIQQAGRVISVDPIPVATASKTSVLLNTKIDFDGSGSYDPLQRSITSYKWSVSSAPAGSTAALTSPTTVKTSFTPDKGGEYTVSLIVSNGTTESVAGKTVLHVKAANATPVAVAGNDTIGVLKKTSYLNGSKSIDADGEALTYLWEIASQPTGGFSTLNYANTPNATFKPTKDGKYIITLTVSDGYTLSKADTVIITVGSTVGLQNNTASSSVKLYPNPANEYIDLTFNNAATGNVTIALLTSTGKQVANLKKAVLPAGAYTERFSLQQFALAKGLYFIEIATANGVITQKLIVR